MDRKMSLWTLKPSLSSSLMRTLVLLTIVVTPLLMHPGCNAAAAAGSDQRQRHPTHQNPKLVIPPKQVQSYLTDMNHLFRSIQKDLAPVNATTESLRKKFQQYSARTARHGWQTPQNKRKEISKLRKDAHHLENRLETYRQRMERYKPMVQYLKRSSLDGFAVDTPTKKQIAQNIQFYELIMELIRNFIECPLHILEILDSGESNESEVETENEVEDYEAGPDYEYNY